MMSFDVMVEVRLRPGIADPPAATIARVLPTMGFDEISAVSMGKAIRLRITAPDEAAARARVEDLTRRLLTNPVMEDALISIQAVSSGGSDA